MLNRVVDGLFLLDIVINFFVPYRAHRNSGGLMISDNRRMAMHYLRGWFVLDLSTSIPFDLVAEIVIAADASSDADVREFRIFKMFRLLKLMRIIRASRILNRWQDRVAISWAMFKLLEFATLVVVLGHWLACLWGYVGSRGQGYDWSAEFRGFDARQSWRQGDCERRGGGNCHSSHTVPRMKRKRTATCWRAVEPMCLKARACTMG